MLVKIARTQSLQIWVSTSWNRKKWSFPGDPAPLSLMH